MRLPTIILGLLCLATNIAMADCQGKRPATPEDLAALKPALLFKKMIAACESGLPREYFSLQTVDFRQSNLKRSLGEQEAMLAVNCEAVAEIAQKVGGDPQNAMYIVKHGPREQCGQKESVLFLHAKDGTSLATMKVAIENEQLKIDEY